MTKGLLPDHYIQSIGPMSGSLSCFFAQNIKCVGYAPTILGLYFLSDPLPDSGLGNKLVVPDGLLPMWGDTEHCVLCTVTPEVVVVN